MKPIYAMRGLVVLCAALGVIGAYAQQPAPASTISKSITAVGYQLGNATKVDLKGTNLAPEAEGKAKIDPKRGTTKIEVDVRDMDQAVKFGNEFLTYVLWAVSPEGRAGNLGEIHIDSYGYGKLTAGTPLQVFSLIVTAEPYFSVRQPSEVVVLENEVRKDTKGNVLVVNEYQLMRRNQYEKMGNPLALTLDLKNTPLEVYEARNAVDIARSRAAGKYAGSIFMKAEDSLEKAENALARKANKKEIISTARQAVQFSEDARLLSAQRQEEERVASELDALKARVEAEEKAALESAEASRRADEEARRQAELATLREARVRAENDAAMLRAKALADAEARRQAELAAAREAQMNAATGAAKQAAAEAQRLRLQAERDQAELRQKLLHQFSKVLETRDTDRGLVVNLPDVLFDSGQYTVRPSAREKLARLAGIVINYPRLDLRAEGHTDNVGSEALNQHLSENRAQAVRDFLVSQGVTNSITVVGMGFRVPVEANTTAVGRQKNRRVELIISGEVIGLKVGTVRN